MPDRHFPWLLDLETKKKKEGESSSLSKISELKLENSKRWNQEEEQKGKKVRKQKTGEPLWIGGLICTR